MNDVQRCRGRMLRLLARREYTRQELRDRGARWGYPPDLVDQAILSLVKSGSVDDLRAARGHVEARLRNRPSGRARLRAELARRGIPPEIQEQALSGVDDRVELAGARELAARKRPSLAQLPREVRRRRLAGALARRGYPSHLIRRILEDEPDPEEDAG